MPKINYLVWGTIFLLSLTTSYNFWTQVHFAPYYHEITHSEVVGQVHVGGVLRIHSVIRKKAPSDCVGTVQRFILDDKGDVVFSQIAPALAGNGENVMVTRTIELPRFLGPGQYRLRIQPYDDCPMAHIIGRQMKGDLPFTVLP